MVTLSGSDTCTWFLCAALCPTPLCSTLSHSCVRRCRLLRGGPLRYSPLSGELGCVREAGASPGAGCVLPCAPVSQRWPLSGRSLALSGRRPGVCTAVSRAPWSGLAGDPTWCDRNRRRPQLRPWRRRCRVAAPPVDRLMAGRRGGRRAQPPTKAAAQPSGPAAVTQTDLRPLQPPDAAPSPRSS